jgi:rRNA maturation protein Nop10
MSRTCPDCGQETYYHGKSYWVDIHKKRVAILKDLGLDVTLVIPETCSECGELLDGKKFQLEIKYPDHSDLVQVELNDFQDLRLMEQFLQGSDRYDAGQIGERPLKDKVDRLRELFGVND